ncbi:IS4 family transposase [Vreelandella rituensis]|nr:IS4 family transposase [Halomonas rituensis]
MQAPQFLHNLLTSSLPAIHTQCLKTLLDIVGALLGERRLGLTALDRALPGSVATKHTIKWVDRLLDNPHLHQERPLFYWLVASLLIGHTTRLMILVNWSTIDDRGRQFLLRAAVPFAGRSLPIFEMVHHKDGSQHGEACLLAALAEILPDNAAPILITDAGFRNPWFRAVEARGWYYVGRVRSPVRCQLRGHEWHRYRVPWAPSRSLKATRSLLYHRPPQARKHRNKGDQISQNSASRAIARRQKEPWVLVSNLPERSTLADKRVSIYQQRMQIKEGFRDIKSPLFGLGLGFGIHPSHQGKRIEILLLIAALSPGSLGRQS